MKQVARHLLKRSLRALPLLVLLGIGTASANSGTAFFGVGGMVLYKEVRYIVGSLGLVALARAIGVLLLLLFFTAGALGAAMSGSGRKLGELLVKALMAAALIALTPAIQDGIYGSWEWAHDWAVKKTQEGGIFGSLANSDAGSNREKLFQAVTSMTDTYTDVASKVVPLSSYNLEHQGGEMGGFGGVTALVAAFAFKQVMFYIRLAVLPMIILFTVIMLTSALSIILVAVLFPIGAAMLVSGMFASAVPRWMGIIAQSYLTVLLLPLMYALLINVSIVTPIVQTLDSIDDAVNRWELNRAALEAGEEHRNLPSFIAHTEHVANHPQERMIAEFIEARNDENINRANWTPIGDEQNQIDQAMRAWEAQEAVLRAAFMAEAESIGGARPVLSIWNLEDLIRNAANQLTSFLHLLSNIFDALVMGILLALAGLSAGVVLLMNVGSMTAGLIAAGAGGAGAKTAMTSGSQAGNVLDRKLERGGKKKPDEGSSKAGGSGGSGGSGGGGSGGRPAGGNTEAPSNTQTHIVEGSTTSTSSSTSGARA